MDETDARICGLLMANSRVPLRELADQLGLSLQAVHRRIQVMQEQGVIRGYPASLSFSYLNAVVVYLFGTSSLRSMEDAVERLKGSDRTYIVLVCGLNYLSIGAVLKDLSELEEYLSFARSAARIEDLKVGLMSMTKLGRVDMGRTDRETDLTALDYRIVHALKDDARRPVEEVAAELGTSAATARRRLARMVEHGMITLGMDWRPSASGDMVSQLHVTLRGGADKLKVANALASKHSSRVLALVTFSNLPDFLLVVVWTSTMKELGGLVEAFSAEEGVEMVTPNVIISEHRFPTWVDKIVDRRGGPSPR